VLTLSNLKLCGHSPEGKVSSEDSLGCAVTCWRERGRERQRERERERERKKERKRERERERERKRERERERERKKEREKERERGERNVISVWCVCMHGHMFACGNKCVHG